MNALLLLPLSFTLAAEPPKNAGERPAQTVLEDQDKRSLYNDTKNAQPEVSAVHPHGWFKGGASLLYYDEKGDLAKEVPLVSEEEPNGTRLNAHEVVGGAAANARFAWALERTTTWNQDRTKVYASRRLLRVFGSEGRELWSTSEADAPENGDPVTFSGDGETMIVALHGASGWTAAIKGWAGNTIYEVGPVPRLQLMTLTRNGRYAMVRWIVPDQSATHTFVEVPTKTRQDVPSAELYLGLARITEDGKVYSGKRFVFDFAAAKAPEKAPEAAELLPSTAAAQGATPGGVFPSTGPLAAPAPPDLDRR